MLYIRFRFDKKITRVEKTEGKCYQIKYFFWFENYGIFWITLVGTLITDETLYFDPGRRNRNSSQ